MEKAAEVLNEPTFLDIAAQVGAAATPLLVIGLGAIGWMLRTQIERRMILEDKLWEGRVETYNQILEPFVMLLMTEEAWRRDPKNKNKDKNEIATTKMLSLEYRHNASKLSLFGSDDVVRAYNNLMQYFNNLMQYFFDMGGDTAGSSSVEGVKKMVALLGQFLLEIRRSVGNESTKLDAIEMLEWFLKDARSYR